MNIIKMSHNLETNNKQTRSIFFTDKRLSEIMETQLRHPETAHTSKQYKTKGFDRNR